MLRLSLGDHAVYQTTFSLTAEAIELNEETHFAACTALLGGMLRLSRLFFRSENSIKLGRIWPCLSNPENLGFDKIS